MRGWILSVFMMVLGVFLSAGCGPGEVVQQLNDIEPARLGGEPPPNLPYDSLVAMILDGALASGTEDSRYQSFEKAVQRVTCTVLDSAAGRFKLEPWERDRLQMILRDNERDVAAALYPDFRSLYEKENIPVSDEAIIQFHTFSAAESFSVVLSDRMCSMAGSLIPLLAQSSQLASQLQRSKLVLLRPCEIILAEILKPILRKLQTEGLLQDHKLSRANIVKHVREMILELATAQDNFKMTDMTTISKTISIPRIFDDLAVSKSKLCVKYVATIKAGFDLGQYFSLNMDTEKRVLIITLPKPQILSVDIQPMVDLMDEGWAVPIKKEYINESYERARTQLIDTAKASGLLLQAEQNARQAITMAFDPVVANPFFQYELRLIFQGDLQIEEQSEL